MLDEIFLIGVGLKKSNALKALQLWKTTRNSGMTGMAVGQANHSITL